MTSQISQTTAELYEQQKRLYPFDPTYGFNAEKLSQIQMTDPEPPGFDAFWGKTFEENEKVPLRWEEKPSRTSYAGFRVKEIYFDTLGGWRVGAWLCSPEDKNKIRRVSVMGHGYGGRENIENLVPDKEAAMLFICAPGFNLSVDEKRVPSNNSSEHVVFGIESPETYILRFCAAAHWSAARLMRELYPDKPLVYQGTSFGGGMGTLMLPWERRYLAAELVQPTFSNHPFRVQHPCQGSGEAVRQMYLKKPEILKTLAYYDSVFAARRIRVPVVFGLSIFDPAVPAPGQFSVANAVDPTLTVKVPTLFGHMDVSYPQLQDEQKRHQQEVEKLFARVQKAWRG